MVRIRSRSVLADFLNNMARVHLLVALAVPLNVGELLAAEPDWVPATRYARLGAASVRVSEVQVGETIFIKGPPGPGRLRDSSDFIRITVSVGNSSENAKVDYESWGYTSWLVCRHRARLTDDFGNNYRPLSLDLGVQLDGQIGYRALAPGDWIKDIMYFEKPIPQATSLRLELPGSAVGERGSLKFSIPRKMWDKGYLTPAEREARRQLEAERYQKEKEERVKQAAIQLKRDAEIMAQKKAEREKQG